MPKILCTLPNASDLISGVKFATHAKGMVSEDVSDDVAAAFASIPGYEIVSAAPAPDADAEATEKAALIERAAVIEFKIKANWSLERLKAEVEAAEASAAAEAAAK